MKEPGQLDFNQPQTRYITCAGKQEGVSVWGRGTGKSSLIAWDIHEIVQTMPRSCWVIAGSTYKQVLTRTLPSTISSLERLGYVQNRHFFVGRKPPPTWDWPRPYEGPLAYDHFIIFWNGTGFHLVSLDAGGSSSRGLNVDGFIADEALLLDKDKLDADLSATNRGNLRYFGDNPKHHGVFVFSSMPYGDVGRWLLEKGNYYESEGIDLVAQRNLLIDAQVRFIDATDDEERVTIWRDEVLPAHHAIRYYPTEPTKTSGRLFYSEANAFDNIRNLGIKYLENQRRFLSDFIFQIEIMNRRPTTVKGGFYGKLDTRRHVIECANDDFVQSLGYDLAKLSKDDCRSDSDCIPTLPLRIAVDWGARISVLTVAQWHPQTNTYRFLKGLYVKHPQLIPDLVRRFCDYYGPHLKREVQFIEDAEWGNARRPDSPLTLNEQFIQLVRREGWRVTRFNLGRTPGYPARYQLAHHLLSEADPRAPRLRFNKVNCKELVTAMLLTPVRQDRKGSIEKDKSSERRESMPAEHATHFTDTFDLHLLSIDQHVVNLRPDFSSVLIV